ncbi:hypothetical protein D3C74_396180 [compost metagenome]
MPKTDGSPGATMTSSWPSSTFLYWPPDWPMSSVVEIPTASRSSLMSGATSLTQLVSVVRRVIDRSLTPASVRSFLALAGSYV